MPSVLDLREILDQGLCHRCGSCSGICPTRVIEPDDNYFPSWEGREDRCVQCGLCVRVCPGKEFSFPDHCRRFLNVEPDLHREHGFFRAAFLAYATDPEVRAGTTSGGLGTELPRYLLRTGRVAGFVGVESDPERGWRPRPFVARTEADLLRARYSKYAACSLNHLWTTLRKEKGPFALSALPCHLHGLRKMAALDRRIAERLDVTIGLFCHSCLDHTALRDLLAVYRMGERDLTRVIYRHTKLPGYVRAQTRTGEWLDLPYPHAPSGSYRPDAKECLTLLFKFYSPERCRLCLDSMAEFGDIAIGDPWIAGWPALPKLYAGYNMVLARTEKGLRLLEEARDAGAIALEPFDAARVPTNHQPMVRNKRLRALYRIERRKRRGQAWPDYGVDRRLTLGERIHVILHVATYWFADKPAARRRILRALLSRPGRWLVGLIFLRRRYFGRRWARLRARSSLA